MSRYKKVSHNEVELQEIAGNKPVLRVSRDEKLQVIELFFDSQKNKQLDFHKARNLMTDLLYKSLYLWENNKRTDKREEGSEDVNREDIDGFVVDNLFEVWVEILNALDIVDKKKLEELQKEQKENLESETQKSNPN